MAKVTAEQIMQALEMDDMTGYCINCGADHSNCEPDARARKCNECGKRTVYGAEELLIMGYAG